MVTSTKTKPINNMAKKTIERAKPAVKTEAAKDKKSGADAFMDAHPTLKHTLAQIEKEFGEGAIMPLGTEHPAHIVGISTGCLAASWKFSARNRAAKPR